MSHFLVVVCLDDENGDLAKAAQIPPSRDRAAALRAALDARLEHVMARWDENREVEPYRDYEDGGPAEHWVYASLQRTADNYAAGTGIPTRSAGPPRRPRTPPSSSAPRRRPTPICSARCPSP